jgi:hypothetical protein
MNMAQEALLNMAYRYKQAAQSERDLKEAEKLTAKAVEYYEAYRSAK